MPEPGDRKIIVADGHDVGGSLAGLRCIERGMKSKRFQAHLTPSGQVLVEGQRYQMEWVMRFRLRRGKSWYDLLGYRGAWEIVSEALDS